MNFDDNERIMEISKRISGQMDAHLVESVVSLFNRGVLTHYVRSPRQTFNPENCHLTIDAANGVRFEGRERLIELETLCRELVEMVDIAQYYYLDKEDIDRIKKIQQTEIYKRMKNK